MREAFRGDLLLLRDGTEVEVADIDAKSGWPIVQLPSGRLVAIDPITIQEGWGGDNYGD